MRRFVRPLALAALLSIGASVQPMKADTFSGAYLAAVQADMRNDYATAARFYVRALARQPNDPRLLQSTLVARIAAGDTALAVPVADQLKTVDATNQIGSLVRIADGIATGDFADAKAELEAADSSLNPLLRALLGGWVEMGLGNFSEATAAFDAMTQNDAIRLYGRYHKALALAMVGDFAGAADLFADDGSGQPLHLNRTGIIAHVKTLAQLERNDQAIAIIDESLSNGFADSELEALRDALRAGDEITYDIATTAAHGAAEAFQILAGALEREDAARFGLIYARLATHMYPEHAASILLTADILDVQEQFDLAIDVYSQIPAASPWYVSAEIGRADAMEASDKLDAALEVLRDLARERPGELSIANALGDMLRRNEIYEEAADAYTTAIALLESENASHWVLYYSRGIAHERTDQWDQAEADFRKALDLQPDQPLVLNYLGYSMVELGENLAEAQEMIEKAVAERPNDGYITDSLAWVLYRLGKYEEAVPIQEKAVELIPVDPILNDHLGDIYWKVGRLREAEFQWRRALSFEPEEKDAFRIREKLKIGLDAVLEAEAAADAAAAETAQDG